jgi:sugar phosphate isomerase/epimerase
MKSGGNIKGMKLGYMPDFPAKLLSEVEFAKRHFDFVEITLKMDLSEYTEEVLKQLKKVLGRFEVLGHLHWEVNLSKKEISPDKNQVFEMISIYEQLGVKRITIHPSSDEGDRLEDIKKNNLKHLLDIAEFCRKKEIMLMVENNAHGPFDRADIMEELISELPDQALTLDIGHANQFGEWDNFLKMGNMIKHLHLHDNVGKKDHLAFKDKTKLDKILASLKDIDYFGSITLEMFFSLEGDNYSGLPSGVRHDLLVKQAKLIRDFGL